MRSVSECDGSAVLLGCANKVTEQRVGTVGPGFEFRMELNAYKPWLIPKLYDLHQLLGLSPASVSPFS